MITCCTLLFFLLRTFPLRWEFGCKHDVSGAGLGLFSALCLIIFIIGYGQINLATILPQSGQFLLESLQLLFVR